METTPNSTDYFASLDAETWSDQRLKTSKIIKDALTGLDPEKAKWIQGLFEVYMITAFKVGFRSSIAKTQKQMASEILKLNEASLESAT